MERPNQAMDDMPPPVVRLKGQLDIGFLPAHVATEHPNTPVGLGFVGFGALRVVVGRELFDQVESLVLSNPQV